MDSKLVVEQMSGNWKIKHADMKPLALEANRLAPFGTTYTWVPREQNKHADRLANEALDGKRNGVTVAVREQDVPPTEAADETEQSEPSWIAWRRQVQTTLVLVRHGVTDHTSEQRFSGGLHERQPRAQRRGPRPDPGHRRLAGARWPSGSTPWSPRPYAAPASPARSSPSASGCALEEEPGFAEMEFGTWDGLTFDEVAATQRAGPGEVAGVARRAAGRRRVAGDGPGARAGRPRPPARARTRAAPSSSPATSPRSRWSWPRRSRRRWRSQFRMELRPASVTVVTFFTPPEGDTVPASPALRVAAAVQHARPGVDLFDESTRW